MPSKKDVDKRRVAAQQATAAREQAATSRERKRRRTVGLLGAFLAVMLVVPLAAGLIATFDDGGDSSSDLPDDLAQPANIRPTSPGASISGETPCPATDGTQERTTSFEQPPGTCIDPASTYEVVLTTDLGDITVLVDPSVNEDAANLFVTMARYGAYDDMPFGLLDPQGLVVAADPATPSPGFTVGPLVPIPTLAVGAVALFADDDQVSTPLAFVATPFAAEFLDADGTHPTVGTITAGQEVIDLVLALGSSPETTPLPIADIRIQAATVAELG